MAPQLSSPSVWHIRIAKFLAPLHGLLFIASVEKFMFSRSSCIAIIELMDYIMCKTSTKECEAHAGKTNYTHANKTI